MFLFRRSIQRCYLAKLPSDTLFLSIHNVTDQLVSCLRKVNTFPPRFKLYWIVYFGVLRDFMSALIKHGLFPEASTSSQAAIDLAGALNNPKQKSLFLSKQRSELTFQGRKYSRLFSNCSPDLLALVSVAYCVSISKQLGKLQEEAASEMFLNQYFGGYKITRIGALPSRSIR